VMGAIIVGRFGAPLTLSRQRDFWGKHVAPWAGHFFTDLKDAKTASLYARVGEVGRAFMDIEREAFRLAAA
jgi:TorA maturation chaperone TorD